MNKQRRLLLSRNIFILIIFICFGVIVVTEKSRDLLIPKAEEKLSKYLEETYPNLDNITKSKTTFNGEKYQMKISSKENKNLFFYIYYINKKTTDTYKKDYLEGKNLLEKIKKDLQKEIKTITDNSFKVKINSKLNEYTTLVRERIIKEDNLKELKFYSLEKDLVIDNWNSKEITSKITKLIDSCYKNKITPKSYNITITNKKDITESILISNLDEEFLNNKDKEKIINDILEDNNSKLIKTAKIKYKYLN